VRCHLGVAPQERTAEEHTTRGLRKTRATSGHVISGGMVSRGWSLWTVQCEGGTYPARISTTNASRQRSSTSYSPESMAADRVERSAATNPLHLRLSGSSRSRLAARCDERDVGPH
jgi:hypothetical protein